MRDNLAKIKGIKQFFFFTVYYQQNNVSLLYWHIGDNQLL